MYQFDDLETLKSDIQLRHKGEVVKTTFLDVARAMKPDHNGIYLDNIETASGAQIGFSVDGFYSLATQLFGGAKFLHVFKDPDILSETKLRLILDKAEQNNTEVALRCFADGGSAMCDSVSLTNAGFITPWELVYGLIKMRDDDQLSLPKDIKIENGYISNTGGNIHVRLISQDQDSGWTYYIDRPNGKPDPYYGALVVDMKDYGAELMFKPALQRLECLNYGIGETLFSTEHNAFYSYQSFLEGLNQGARQLTNIFEGMRSRHQRMQEVEIENPAEFLDVLLQELGVTSPQAVNEANTYLANNYTETLDAPYQAVTAAAQVVKTRTMQRFWTARSLIEGGAYTAIGVNALDRIDEGGDPNMLYLNDVEKLRRGIKELVIEQSKQYEDDPSIQRVMMGLTDEIEQISIV